MGIGIIQIDVVAHCKNVGIEKAKDDVATLLSDVAGDPDDWADQLFLRKMTFSKEMDSDSYITFVERLSAYSGKVSGLSVGYIEDV